MPEPKYRVILRKDGSIKVMRSDGDDCSLEEAEWIRVLLTRSLREKILVENPNFRGFREKLAVEKGTTARGKMFDVDKLIYELEDERLRQGLSRSSVAAALFENDSRLTSYVRGRARPHMQLLRLWSYVLGLTIITVPRQLEDRVRGMVEEWRGTVPTERTHVDLEVEQ